MSLFQKGSNGEDYGSLTLTVELEPSDSVGIVGIFSSVASPQKLSGGSHLISNMNALFY